MTSKVDPTMKVRTMEATVKNMRAWGAGDTFAWSPDTGEEYSADPNDYLFLDPDSPLTDSNGNPMVLARRVSFIELVGDPDTYEDNDDETDRRITAHVVGTVGYQERHQLFEGHGE